MKKPADCITSHIPKHVPRRGICSIYRNMSDVSQTSRSEYLAVRMYHVYYTEISLTYN